MEIKPKNLENKKITVLYTRKDSVYKELGADTWDIDRDARKWKGGSAIIAHPPCRGWGRYRNKAKTRPDEHALAIHAIIMIRLYGGILEHPQGSALWDTMKLPKPGQKPDHYGGWTLSINQKWFGHKAEKKTYLYIVGVKPKEIPAYKITFDTVTRTIESMAKKQREETPKELAKWLIKTAEICNKNGSQYLSM